MVLWQEAKLQETAFRTAVHFNLSTGVKKKKNKKPTNHPGSQLLQPAQSSFLPALPRLLTYWQVAHLPSSDHTCAVSNALPTATTTQSVTTNGALKTAHK